MSFLTKLQSEFPKFQIGNFRLFQIGTFPIWKNSNLEKFQMEKFRIGKIPIWNFSKIWKFSDFAFCFFACCIMLFSDFMAISPVLAGFGWFHSIPRVKLRYTNSFIVPLKQPKGLTWEREPQFLLF